VDPKGADLRRDDAHGSQIVQFVRGVKLKNGTPITIRAIRTSDEALLARFHEKLSDRSVYLRYFSFTSLSHRIAHAQLARTCLINDREFALVAILRHEGRDEPDIIGLGQMIRQKALNEVEPGLIVGDEYQNQGLGTRLCECLLEISRASGVQRVVSLILWENYAMRHIGRRFGCSLEFVLGEHAAQATLIL
jgi:acetyltransferase